ncbi:MAG: hypothetical protein EXS08_02195 [Planctomycetes bacterium]|nr:hypothetical protein [Planctomycetota bacterium]
MHARRPRSTAPRAANPGSSCASALLALTLAACTPEPAPRPSFVLVLADDLGWADVGFQGSRFQRTPAIDRLAADGLSFSNAYAAAPVCSPSRAALLTGLAPARLHLTKALGPHAPTEEDDERETSGELVEPTVVENLPAGPTLGTELGAAGYRTAWIGKWHLGETPRAHGFETSLADSTAGATPSYFAPYGIPSLPDGPPGEYLTDRLTDEAVRFLRAQHEQPFLLVLSHYAPHLPLAAPPALVAEFEQRADPSAPQHNPVYAAMIARLDASVERLRATLEELHLAEHTLLLFTSDNGGFESKRLVRKRKAGPGDTDESVSITSNLPLRSGKGRLYEGGLRVPLVAWGGPLLARGTSAVPVIGMDLLPTLLALAGRAPPPICDGLDLAPLLCAERGPARDALYFHFPHQTFQSALRAGDEKLVYGWREERAELYDLSGDPGELHDLAAERPQRAGELQSKLFRWLDAVGAARPERR